MLLRMQGEAVIAIPQPAHAVVSGQMARAWGNDRFARPAPFEPVCLGVTLHDLGWLAFEEAPTLNPKTGLPHQFAELPPASHIALWSEGVRRARAFGRYPALLVSKHADTIYGRFFDFAKAAPEEAAAVRAFLDSQHAIQAELVTSLQADAETRDEASEAAIERNRLLVAALDWISLKLCYGLAEPATIPDVPVAGDARTSLALRPGEGPDSVFVDPWPFGPERVEVEVEGKPLAGRFTSDEDLREALARAPSLTLRMALLPG